MVVTYLFLFTIDFQMESKIRTTIKSKQSWVIDLENESYDYLFLGSSRVYNQLDAQLVEKFTNKRTINLGLSGVGAAEQLLILELFLEDNRAKHVFIQLDDYSFNSTTNLSYPFHDYEYLAYADNDLIGEAFRNELGPIKHYFWKTIPALKYFEFNEKYPINTLWKKDITSTGFDKKGSLILEKHEITPQQQIEAWKDHSLKEHFIFDTKTLENINAIFHLLKERNITTTIYTSPELLVEQNHSELRIKCRKQIKILADKYKCRWIDLSKKPAYHEKTLFLDKTHLNRKGATLFARALSSQLIE